MSYKPGEQKWAAEAARSRAELYDAIRRSIRTLRVGASEGEADYLNATLTALRWAEDAGLGTSLPLAQTA